MTPDETSTVTTLRDAMADETRGHHLRPTAVTTALAHVLADEPDAGAVVVLDRGASPRTSRRRTAPWLAAAAIVAAVALITTVLAGSRDQHATQPAAGAATCAFTPVTAPLPVWARDGFSPPGAAQRYVLGLHSRIVAILFTPTLSSPPARGRNNKILWVSREPSTRTPLVIRARTAGSGEVVRRTVPDGPGPSTIDLPHAGCWRLNLSWSGRHDVLDLGYVGG